MLPRMLALNTSFGGSEDFNKTGLDGALYSPNRCDCLIATWHIFNGQNTVLLKDAN